MDALTIRRPFIWRLFMALNFFGFALGHFVCDQSYRSVLWNQSLLEGPLHILGISWSDWVTDPDYSLGIDLFRQYMGGLFFILSIAALKTWHGIWNKIFISLGIMSLSWLGLCRWAGHAYDILWPSEFALRIILPFGFCVFRERIKIKQLRFVFLTACSLTFFGHGCYALGWYPTPVTFRYMLGVFFDGNIDTLLIVVGIVDIAVAIALWIPHAQRWTLLWMSFWGFLTAAMRLGFIDSYFWADTAGPAIADWLERLVHGFIPVFCFQHFCMSPRDLKDEHDADTTN